MQTPFLKEPNVVTTWEKYNPIIVKETWDLTKQL